MSDHTVELSGEELTLEEYFAEFDERFWKASDCDCWKLERRQTFIEQGSDSYDAFARGDWTRALELLKSRRSGIAEYYAKAAARGISVLRARVVEEPISPYLVWQLNSLLQRSELGEHPRIVTAGQVVAIERDGVLPELVGLADDVVYQVIYGSDGAAERAIRSAHRPTVEHWHRVFHTLYEGGEEMASFFSRNVAGLSPSNTR
jgi:uncharacterized protein DUF6879